MKQAKFLVIVSCLVLWGEASAVFSALSSSPATVNVQGSTSISVNSGPGQENLTLAQATDKTAPRPALQVSPSSFSVTWDINCLAENVPASSPRGTFSLNNRQIAVSGPSSTAGICALPTSIQETVVIPKAVADAVLNEFLRTTRVAEVVKNPRLSKSISVVYSRTYSVPGTSRTSSVTIAFLVSPVVTLNSSRLVSVGTRGQSTFLPVNAGAGAVPAIPVTWVASIETTGKGNNLTISSKGIEYRTDNGELIQFQSRPLNRIYNPGFAVLADQPQSLLAGLLGTVRDTLIQQALAALSSVEFSESLTIPRSVLVRARQSGASRVIASRRFSDGSASFSANYLIPMGSSNQFQITRVDLYFTAGIRNKVVNKDANLRAVVDINYIGTGQLRGVWEWAPVQPGGVPLFRPLPAAMKRLTEPDKDADYYKPRDTLTVVREYLTSFKRVSLRSPLLPTNNKGSYLLRLRIDSPKVGFTLPVVQYFVNMKPDDVNQAKSAIPLLMLNPPLGQDAMASTNFKWSRIPDTNVYRFEIYLDEEMSTDMVTAALVKNENTSLQLTPLVYSHLVSGKTYWFRVVSLDNEGRLVATSQLSPLKVR